MTATSPGIPECLGILIPLTENHLLIVAPKKSVSLMWFNGVMPRPNDALDEASRFDSLRSDDPLLADLSEEELARIVNWDVGDHGTHPPHCSRTRPIQPASGLPMVV